MATTVETIRDQDYALYAEFDGRFQSRESRFGLEREAVAAVPVIDFSPFAKGGSEAARNEVGRQIRAACIDIGFFYLAGHGISQADIDAAIAQSHRFFEQPLDFKMRYDKKDHPAKSGFMRIGGTEPDSNPDAAADLKETYNMLREPLPGEPETPFGQAGMTQWPDESVLPRWKPCMQGYIAKQVTLQHRLARAFALSLDLPETHFDEIYKYFSCVLTLNYYPAFEGTRLPTQWSISPHSDYGSWTVLAQDALGGLQVRNVAGQWIDVPPVPGTFVVNIGDLMAIWTNDLYTPSLHRALNTATAARVSVPFFVLPQGQTMVECLPTCRSDTNPPRYTPRRAGDHVKTLVEQSYRTGRPGVAKDTAKRLTAAE